MNYNIHVPYSVFYSAHSSTQVFDEVEAEGIEMVKT